MPGSWRRYAPFLAQVGFLVGDLRRKMGSYALHWRRSPPFFLTCANIPLHLRQNIGTCTGFQRHLRQNIGTCAKIPIHLHHVVGKVNRNYWTMWE